MAEAMAAVGVDGLAGRSFAALSGGERARAALVLRLCRGLVARAHAVVVVLHDLGLAAAYADRVAVLHDGRLAAGKPHTVFTEGLLSRVYRHPIEILRHPSTGVRLVLPQRPEQTSP